MDLQHTTLTQKVSIGIFTVSLVMLAGISSSFAMNHGEKENDDHRGMHREMMKNMTPEEREAHFEERFEKMTQDMSADEKAKIRANHDEMVKIHEEISALEKPEDWEDYTKEERHEFLKENEIDVERIQEIREEMPHPKMEKMKGMKNDMKDMMQDMTPEEREAHFEERFEKMTENMSEEEKEELEELHDEMMEIHEEISALEKPEDWEDYTKEERHDFLEESGIDVERIQEIREEMPHPKMDKMQKKMKDMKGGLKEARNFIKKAKKAKHFKKNLWKNLKAKKEFRDEAKMKHKDAISFLQQRGILKGYDDGNFQPEKEINRAESIKVLLESLGEGPSTGEVGRDFSDVKSSDWFAGYVTKAKARNIIKGYKDGTFQPAKTVNQAELLKVAFESFGIDLSDYEVSDLPETVSTDAWFAVYFQYALDNELLDEEDVNPSQGMTRDAFSSVVSRLIQQQEAL